MPGRPFRGAAFCVWLGGKYKTIALYHQTVGGTLRFSQLQRRIPQATAKMLSQQLRELEADEPGMLDNPAFVAHLCAGWHEDA